MYTGIGIRIVLLFYCNHCVFDFVSGEEASAFYVQASLNTKLIVSNERNEESRVLSSVWLITTFQEYDAISTDQ